MTLTEWGNQIVLEEVPFKPRGRGRDGLDCWGLVWLAYREVYGIDVPSYAEIYEPDDVKNLKQVGAWIEERANEWVKVERGESGDCVLLRLYGRPVHVGLIIDPKSGDMLHIERGIYACYESYQTSKWRSRIFGFFRHQSRCGDAPV